MKRKPADLVIEAAHFKRNGLVDFVRAYQRRGATYSDCILLKRGELIELIEKGEKVVTGKRVPLMGSTFIDLMPVRTETINNRIIITAGTSATRQGDLTEIPTI